MALNRKVGDRTVTGNKIDLIIVNSQDVVIFYDESGQVCWEADESIVINPKLHHKYEMLGSIIISKCPSEATGHYINRLSKIWYNVLLMDDEKEAIGIFNEFEKEISLMLFPSEAKTTFLLSSIALTLFIVISLVFVGANLPPAYHVGVASLGAGCCGSLFSQLQRNSEIILPLDQGRLPILYQAGFSAFLGAMSGFTVFLFIKSNLILGLTNGNDFAVIVFTVLAGFSERFVPLLFHKLERSEGE